MHTQSKTAAVAANLATYFDTPSNYAHAANVAALVLEPLPNGEHVWLRPADDHDPRYVLTDLGRRALALDALFGQPWPTVAQATSA
jgi:hypothetical protein